MDRTPKSLELELKRMELEKRDKARAADLLLQIQTLLTRKSPQNVTTPQK